jgi:hypothetical protein
MNKLTNNKGYKEPIDNIGSVFNKAKGKIIINNQSYSAKCRITFY